MGRVLNEEQIARKNEYNRLRDRKLRELNIEMVRALVAKFGME